MLCLCMSQQKPSEASTASLRFYKPLSRSAILSYTLCKQPDAQVCLLSVHFVDRDVIFTKLSACHMQASHNSVPPTPLEMLGSQKTQGASLHEHAMLLVEGFSKCLLSEGLSIHSHSRAHFAPTECPLGLRWELLSLDVEECHGHRGCVALQKREPVEPVCHSASGVNDYEAAGCCAVKAFGK